MRKNIFECALAVVLLFVFIPGVGIIDKALAVNVEDNSSQTENLVSDDENKSDFEGRGDVMGTSVVVTTPDNELDIKRIETEEIYQDGNIPVKITLENLSDSDQQIEKAVLSVKKLDGTVELSESIDIKKNVQATVTTEISMEFPGNLTEGKYVGVIELYSKEHLLGRSETILSVSSTLPEVLGASVENYDYILLLSFAVFAAVLIFSIFLLLKKKTLLLKGISIKLFDLIVVVFGLSIFGIGLCAGYMLCKTFFPSGFKTLSKGYQNIKSEEPTFSDKELDNDFGIKFVYEDESLFIYTKPDENAQINYELKENFGFKIIDQAAGWYRIQLENGEHGWVKIEDVQGVIDIGK